MADPKHPGKLGEELKRQVAEMHDSGEPTSETLEEHDLGSSTFHRWVRAIRENGSAGASGNRAPGGRSSSSRAGGTASSGRRTIFQGGQRRYTREGSRDDVGRRTLPDISAVRDTGRSQVDPLRGARPRGGEPGPGPLAEGVVAARRDGRGRCGAGKIGRAPAKKGEAASRRRIAGTMEGNSLAGACARARFEPHADGPDGAGLPSALDRELDGCAPHAHLAGDPTCVRVLSAWHCTCPPDGPASRETAGHAAGARKDAEPARPAFATVAFPPSDIDVSHSGRGPESDDVALDETLGAFGITRSPSKRGCPPHDAAAGSASKMLKAELVYGESFGSLEEPRVKLGDCVWWHNHERVHSTLGYTGPVEFREKSLTLVSK